MSNYHLETKDINVWFGERHVLKDVNLGSFTGMYACTFFQNYSRGDDPAEKMFWVR